jgi:GntR family transcriptional regulator of vanillate catabolism
MREHSRLAQRNLSEAIHAPHLDHMPAVRLIRQRGQRA